MQTGAAAMSSFEDADTEETVTSLRVTIYHPGQMQGGIFQSIRFSNPEKLPSSEVVKFGRNSTVCHYTFQDKQVSRVQFSLQLFKKFDSSVLSLEIKNMSKRTGLLVGGMELGYLNKVELPSRCVVRFGEYQLLVEKQDGESLEFFETLFTMSPRPLLQEQGWPAGKPTPELCWSAQSTCLSACPTEMDENEY